MDLTPIFRIEKFLDAIVNSTTPPEPVFREEFFLAKIAGADVTTPEPMFRIEKYLAKIAGEDVEIPEPQFRIEFWLAKLCGMDVETPEPIFRVEFWLEEWSGGSTDQLITLTGKIISFISKAAKPFKSTQVAIEPVQDLHGYEAPWPPGGGANKLHPFADGTYTNNGVTLTASGGKYTLSGTSSATWLFDQAINLPAGSYAYAFFNDVVSGGSIYIMDASYNVIANIVITSASKTGTFTIEAAATTLRIRGTSGKTYNNVKLSPMIVSGSTVPTAFSPYSNECPISGWTKADIFNEASYDPTAEPTVTLTFGSTVYGGQATDNGDGSWTVVAKYAEVDLGTQTWSKNANYPVFSATISNIYARERYTENDALCSSYYGVNEWTASVCPNGGFFIREGKLYIGDDRYSTAADFKTAVNGVQFVYRLAEPITFTVSGETLTSLVGTNNAWADTGNITAEVYGTPVA